MRKKTRIFMSVILLIIAVAGGTILKQNSYDIREQAIVIHTPQGDLTGTLVLPKDNSDKLGLVLFIHGDGPIDASHEDGYKPLWERLASLGYASLSLNKRGINGSEGNWLDQSIDDRVEEARQALAWARTQPMIDPERIGVWGASQAGWVIPRLAGQESLAFSILVSPAINWLTQGEYHTRKQMAKGGSSEAEINKQVEYEQQIIELLKKDASYAEYVKVAHKGNVMSEERWSFVSKNFLADATHDLHHFNSPVLLLLGGEDIHVDVRETEQVYRKIVEPFLLTVAVFPKAEHSMLSTKTADSDLRAWLIGLFAPRRITVGGYMEQIEQFLMSQQEYIDRQ